MAHEETCSKTHTARFVIPSRRERRGTPQAISDTHATKHPRTWFGRALAGLRRLGMTEFASRAPYAGDCFRTSDVITPWMRSSRAGIRSGKRGFSAFKYGRPRLVT